MATRNINKFGRNPEIDIATAPEDVWNGGGIYTGQPTGFTPETISIVSSSILDNGVTPNTGARTIQIFGLLTSTSTDYTEEEFTLNGTTPVVSTSTWYRINRAYTLTTGSTGENQGTITINPSTTTANIFCSMPPLFNQTPIGAFTIPFGRTGYLKKYKVSIVRASGTAGSASVAIRIRDTLGGGVYRVRDVFEMSTASPYEIDINNNTISMVAGSDIKISVLSVSDNDTIVSASMNIQYL